MAESAKLEPEKIFVGGLSWGTTKESLIEYFSKYGDVVDGVIMVDSVSKLPRGFGFVTFKDPGSVTTVIQEHGHILDGKKIDPKEAITKDHHASSQNSETTNIDKKVLVGGLPHDCSVEELKSFFSKYGQVSEVDVKIDRATGRPRGFAFVEYQEATSANAAAKASFQMFKDKKVEVKQAENRVPGTTPNQNYPNYVSNQTIQYHYGYPQSTVASYPSGQVSPYQAPQSYPPSHSGPQQPVYAQPPQHSSYPNEYQQYSASYQPQNYTTAYNQQAYSSTPASYSHPYSSFYPQQSDSVAYAPSQASSYFSNPYPTNYSSDSRYAQQPNPGTGSPKQ